MDIDRDRELHAAFLRLLHWSRRTVRQSIRIDGVESRALELDDMQAILSH